MASTTTRCSSWQGEPLDEFILKRQLKRKYILKLVQIVCGAVQHAHEQGIVHRDLKPSNIMVTSSGKPIVLDFGLAKMLGDDEEQEMTLTGVGDIAGTPAYMAPEQAEGRIEAIGPHTDVYALGAILGNTVIVVEHDEDAVLTADYVVDVGPGAGVHGGQVVAQGSPQEVMANGNSLTGQYLSGAKMIPLPAERRKINKKRKLSVKGARGNNLKDVDVDVPLSTFTCVTGVSGGGKSTFLIDTLYKSAARRLNGARDNPAPHDRIEGLEVLDKVIDIDQSPIGRTPRSNPATYTGAFTPIREWFAGMPEAKARGYQPGRFSFNVKGGRCEACQGDGVIKIEMHFLPDVYVTCDVCKGKRYNRETLEVEFKGKSIADVLDMTVEEAASFFSAVPAVRDKMETLARVGLGYIKVGQQATTLSGGEAQRVKLAKELSKRSTGRTLYILDEPTTGLHFHDVAKLLDVLHELVDQGNTVLVIEHNLEVIKTADWIIDLGPEGGDGGGTIVAAGRPEDVASVKASYTGQFLAELLQRRPQRAPDAAE